MQEVFTLEDACVVPKRAMIPLAFHTSPETDHLEDLATLLLHLLLHEEDLRNSE